MFLDYIYRKTHFISEITPAQALALPTALVVDLLEKRYQKSLKTCFTANQIPSPLQQEKDSNWIKSANIVGINVRTIASFWNVVKYALTLPASQNSLHLLPIWECGVVQSLYGMASWHINPEFYSEELAKHFPALDSVEKQLAFVINVLHLMQKSVGMDVIPHTDRFSEMVLENPQYFEWLKRADTQIVSHKNDLWKEAAAIINQNKTNNQPLFANPETRKSLRNNIVQQLYDAGLEPIPATMAPPYRGLKVDTQESAKTVDADGRIWRDYLITNPTDFSRVFNPLARYQLYKNKNEDWEIDFHQPKTDVWAYISNHYKRIALDFGFDYMRGDMAHVQMRPEGVPLNPDAFYDILGYIKQDIQQEKPYFAYYAESFLAPDNVMGYGNELEHLNASFADCTLGDLQSIALTDPAFLPLLNRYLDIAAENAVKPCLTMMTADKDDPRFDAFYVTGNEIRMFLGLFLTDMPSYMALGFECRNVHLSPAPNVFYSKLYVFQETGDKATNGAYRFGQNRELLTALNKIRQQADDILPQITGKKLRILQRPTTQNLVFIWQYIESNFCFEIDFGTLDYKIKKVEV